MPAISEQPSVDDLLARMESEQRHIDALRKGVVYGVPRPPMLERMLLMACCLMLVSICILIGLVGWHALRMTEAIRLRRAEDAALERALPSDQDLTDPHVFERALLRHPYHQTELYAGLARARRLAGDIHGSLEAFREARQHAVTPLPIPLALDEVDILIASNRDLDARQRLLELDLGRADPEQRTRAIRFMAHFADSPVPLPLR